VPGPGDHVGSARAPAPIDLPRSIIQPIMPSAMPAPDPARIIPKRVFHIIRFSKL
jgi:hypothetical protein